MPGDAVAWLARYAGDPWLVVGKGPSADRLTADHVRAHRVLTLNHAVALAPGADAAAFVDAEAARDCRPQLAGFAGRVILPWHPHVNFRPGPKTLDDHAKGDAGLRLAAKDGRLLAYNSDLAPARWRHPRLPAVRVRVGSAVVAFNLLGLAGARRVFTLGVDGGTQYSTAFSDHTRLANGQPSFDTQVPELRRACATYNLEWTRL